MGVVNTTPIRRGDVVLVNLSPTIGGEIRKTRLCLVVSPDELNEHLRTRIVAPLTTGGFAYPFRVSCRLRGKTGSIVLDQVRTIDCDRIVRLLGRVGRQTMTSVLTVLQEMFAE